MFRRAGSVLVDDSVVRDSAARLHMTGAPNLPLEYVVEFCKTFVPEQARCAPEKGQNEVSFVDRVMSHLISVTLIAVGIPLLAEAAGNVSGGWSGKKT